ncbi:MAG: LLM class flavin-dependent oxidoreductase [Dehalococcoidia bacterium]|uniref:Luciferase-like domain-containing protein n=1 Tax=marine metagenome TaxID=408172 RepID=A0A381T203_9ZZZZ|nr:LLM class flavin-dependent oxidoreductase [Dehalococcoidia bacterium]|tara:strand:+ start:623 stop:1822 length:1200 start_codon:yes stop_codon:yes gene_type:complete
MANMRFGVFLAPHHPIGENPTLQLQSDLKLASQLDELGYDEFWCGEHHSTGWEVIASPEIFLAAAAERTQRIKLGTGVISLPYHHPFMVAQRLVQLDHQSRGRLIFGSGPGALPSDAHTLGLDPMLLRDRQDEAMGVIRKLFEGEERFSYESDWFKLRDAKLHLKPLQKNMEFAVASQISPSGMTLAGKHQAGVLSIGAMVAEGMRSLPTQWSFAEESAAKHGNSVDRKNWRIVMNWHIAETRKEARLQAKEGLLRHNNDYSVATLNPDEGTIYKSPDDAVDGVAFSENSTAVIGTPDDLIAKIKEMISITGGFGCVIGFAHDWANRENTLKSWDLVARYVIPEINGLLDDYRESHEFVTNNRETWVRAREAVMNKIESNERSAEIMETQGYEGEKSKS